MKSEIPELEVFTDSIGDGYGIFFEICRAINETGGVVLEDDVKLCKNFKSRLESIVGEKGRNEVISFFERPKKKLQTAYVGGSNFLWMQCIYLPPLLPKKIIAYHDEFKTNRPDQWTGMATDMLIAYTLVQEKIKYWRIRPTLVQHLPFDSVIGSRPRNRQTHYFIDDIEGVGA
jgi:GR25 family glycosyltransferase involved in LPS biosynthesis